MSAGRAREHRARVVAIALFAALAVAYGDEATREPIATVAEGQLHGLRSGEGAIFRSIPFAAPPVGALRWKPPQPASKWRGTRDATKPAAPCLQAFVGWNREDSAHSDEDCLYLDIHTPRLDPHARLPVMVWIHGGANWGGSGHWVADSAFADRGVVVVAIQYRLGVFGFLSHPQLTRESPHGASGNYGLMDQIAALRWVKQNIAAFGGDPNAVTLAGHSAGGQDVGLLLLSPEARGLFARAIQQSGTAGFGFAPRTLAENERLGEQFARLAGASVSGSAGVSAGVGARDGAIAQLRAMPGRALLDAQMLIDSPALDDDSFVFLQAVVDGWILPAAPADLLRGGKSARVPLLIGNAAQELTLQGGDSAVRRAVVAGFGKAAPAALQLYGLHHGTEPPADPVLGNTGLQIANDLTFRCPTEITARWHAASGEPVWRYQMERAEPNAARIDHGAELAFIFSNLPLAADVDGAHPFLQSYWVNFVRTGDPNGPGVPAWPPYSPPDSAYVGFTQTGPQVHHALRADICRLLDRP